MGGMEMSDMISREAAIAAATSCPDSHWGPWIAERLRALPAVQLPQERALQVREPQTDHGWQVVWPDGDAELGNWHIAYFAWKQDAEVYVNSRALPAVQPDAAAIREAALREALGVAAAETDRLRAARKKYALRIDIKGYAMAEGAFRVMAALAELIDSPGKEV